MSGTWRVTVDSWISEQATWYGTTVYVVSGEHVHSLPAALQAIAESPPEVYLAEVARQEQTGLGPAPTEFNVPVCLHGRGKVHLADSGLLCTGPLRLPPEGPLCAQCRRPKNAHSPTRTGGYLTGHEFIDPATVCGHTVEEGCTGHGDF